MPRVRDCSLLYDGQSMMRRHFTLVSALSLVLCVATAAVWVRSYWIQHTVAVNQTKDSWGVSVNFGRIGLFHVFHIGLAENDPGVIHTAEFAVPPRSDNGSETDSAIYFYCNYWGFGGEKSDGGPTCWHVFWLLVWFIVLLTAIPPGAWLLIHRTKRDGTPCRCCGYDLRATPERCPECGTVPSSSKVKA